MSEAQKPDSMDEVTRRVEQVAQENARLFRELAAGERRIRRLAKAIWAVQEEERKRIARELHDGLGQNLTALKIQLGVLEREALASHSKLVPKISETLGFAARALEEARELSHLLRPRILDDLGLEPALRWMGRTLAERTGIQIQVSCPGLEDRLEPELETVIFRVVQEALTNAVKHSGIGDKGAIEVEVFRRGAWVHLRVEDQGTGFDSSVVMASGKDPKGSGLGNIRDRVEISGGRLSVRTAPGKGTRIEVRLPLEGEALANAPEDETR